MGGTGAVLAVAVSLGKTNYLVKALMEKGWIKIGNFRRADNKLRKVVYLSFKW